jgi:hypothetical protein
VEALLFIEPLGGGTPRKDFVMCTSDVVNLSAEGKATATQASAVADILSSINYTLRDVDEALSEIERQRDLIADAMLELQTHDLEDLGLRDVADAIEELEGEDPADTASFVRSLLTLQREIAWASAKLDVETA